MRVEKKEGVISAQITVLFLCRNTGGGKENNPEDDRSRDSNECRKAEDKGCRAEDYRGNQKNDSVHTRAYIGSVSKDFPAESAEGEGIEVVDACDITGVFNQVHEASEEEGAAEEEDERIVCEECKSRDEGESKADKPDVECEKSGHAEDTYW